MGEFTARYKPAQEVTVYASGADITAGRFVTLESATKTAQGDYKGRRSKAGELPFGVAEFDADSSLGERDNERRANVYRAGAVARVTAGAAVSAGAVVASDANGKAITAAGSAIPAGVALTAAANDGDTIEVALVYLPIALDATAIGVHPATIGSPSAGDVVTYDGTKWVDGGLTLDGDDVVVSTAAADDVLAYDGSDWVNAPQTIGGIPVNLSNIQAGDILKYDLTGGQGGTPAWVNGQP